MERAEVGDERTYLIDPIRFNTVLGWRDWMTPQRFAWLICCETALQPLVGSLCPLGDTTLVTMRHLSSGHSRLPPSKYLCCISGERRAIYGKSPPELEVRIGGAEEAINVLPELFGSAAVRGTRMAYGGEPSECAGCRSFAHEQHELDSCPGITSDLLMVLNGCAT